MSPAPISHALSPHYFLKKLRALAANAPSLRRPANWWTKRNQAVFRANMTIPDERKVAATFNRYFNRRRRRRHSYRQKHLRNVDASTLLASESDWDMMNQRLQNDEADFPIFADFSSCAPIGFVDIEPSNETFEPAG